MDVLLISMPFGPVFAPSLGLSLLQAGLRDRGVTVRTRYLSIRFAEIVGRSFYDGVARDSKPRARELAGEWIFSGGLFDWSRQDEDAYIDHILRNRGAYSEPSLVKPAAATLIKNIRSARRHVDRYLDWCVDEVLRECPKIVGFTSVFQQHVASLALARRIKGVSPEIFVVIGGANCEGVMGAETIRQFPFVDAAVSGEGDAIFPELVRRVLDETSIEDLRGVRTRCTIAADFAQSSFPNAAPIRNMDELPYPDYSDYFAQFEASKYGPKIQPKVFVETSRGCWWGEKMHCTFCGLNGATMTYRSKSAPRALAELTTLAERHPGCYMQVVDNILDLSYFKTLIPELAARRLDLELYYETKSNLKKDQIRLLQAAGIGVIQPGIESFSDRVLARMRKGVTGLQNVQLLKWCKELGVKASWNLLFGFPGEEPEEYSRMARWVPFLTHLRPPVSLSAIRLDRFSPNFFDADRLGVTEIQPLASYRHIYQVSDAALANLAYYFSFGHREPRDVAGYVRPLRKEVDTWTRAASHSDLFAVDVGEHLLIWDLRPVGRQPLVVLHGIEKSLYEACDAACDERRLLQLAAQATAAPSTSEVLDCLNFWVEHGLALRNERKYLALAIPLGKYSPTAGVVARFYRIAEGLGRRRGNHLVIRLDSNARSPLRPRKRTKRNAVRPDSRRLTPAPESRLTPRQFGITGAGDLEIMIQ